MASSIKKTVLVTGATGFIGANFVKLLIESEKYNVVPCGRNEVDFGQELFGHNIRRWDVLNTNQPDYCDSVDIIFHCATANNVISEDFQKGVNLTLYGTRNVLEFAVRNDVSEVFFLSTVQVYGTELFGTITPETPLFCETGYALNHYYGEELCRLYNRKYGVKVTIIRPTNVYGIPLSSLSKRDTLVPACFTKEAITRGSIKLKTSGLQYRNFISTSELSINMLELLEQSDCRRAVRIALIHSSLYFNIFDVARLVAKKYRDLFGSEITVYAPKHEKNDSELRFSIDGGLSLSRNSPEVSECLLEQTIEQLLIRDGRE